MLDACILFFTGLWVGGMAVGSLFLWYMPRRELKITYTVEAQTILEYGKLQTTEEMAAFRKKHKDHRWVLQLADIVDEIKYPLKTTDALAEESVNIKRVGWSEFCDTGKD